MTVDLVKHYLLKSFNPETDVVVVLRRYDVARAPWGVHVITVDFSVNFAEQPPISSRPIGLFTADQVRQLAARHRINLVEPVDGGYDGPGNALAYQTELLFLQFLDTQVVPFEWQPMNHARSRRIFFLGQQSLEDMDYMAMCYDHPYDCLNDLLRSFDEPAVEIVELPPMEAAS